MLSDSKHVYRMVTSLEAEVRTTGEVIVAGGVNARAVKLIMSKTDTRGWHILDMEDRMDLHMFNLSKESIFRYPGYGERISD